MLDAPDELAEYLEEFRQSYKAVSAHRGSGLNGPEPLLKTLDVYDRKLGIDRATDENEILLTLDLIERSEIAKRRPT